MTCMFTSTDDFAFPSAQRSDTMSLKTVQQALQSPTQRRARAEPLSLRIDDIPGAQVGTTGNLRKMKFTKNKPDLFNKDDIAGASPIRLIPSDIKKHNKFNVSNADIEYSSPMTHTFKSGRVTDPNNPKYNLPSCSQKPPTPPKQLLESLKVSDIDGSTAKPLHSSKPRATLNTTDIAGTCADSTKIMRIRHLYIPPTMDNDTVNAINNEGTLKTNRTVDPLSPRYMYDVPPGADKDTWKGIGDMRGHHPKGVPAARDSSVASLSLRTEDIDGAHAVTTMPRPHQRRLYRNPVDISDIECSSPTMKHTKFSCGSKRHLDPLNPDYPPLRYRTEVAGAAASTGAFNNMSPTHKTPSPIPFALRSSADERNISPTRSKSPTTDRNSPLTTLSPTAISPSAVTFNMSNNRASNSPSRTNSPPNKRSPSPPSALSPSSAVQNAAGTFNPSISNVYSLPQASPKKIN